MSDNDLLREAATLMRKCAQKATPGRWFLHDCEGDLEIWREDAIEVLDRDEDGAISMWNRPASYRSTDLIHEESLETWDEGEDPDDDQRRADAALMASWGPVPALAVADWLDATAEYQELLDNAREVNSDLGLGMGRLPLHHPGWDRAVATARAYLQRPT